MSGNTCKNCFLIKFSRSSNDFYCIFKVVLINMIAILISAKLAARSLLKVNVFWNKVYDMIILVHDIKKLSCDSKYIVDLFMWPDFDNSSVSKREAIVTLKKTDFFEWRSWFAFNHLRLTLGLVLTFYSILAKGFKLKVKKFWIVIPTLVEIAGGKLVGKKLFASWLPLCWIGERILMKEIISEKFRHASSEFAQNIFAR